jgi:spore coat polysaccharide biosynthesis predicted glycosyltransferase SpsG
MRVSFFCKASTRIGFGHLIRSRSLALAFIEANRNIVIHFYLVTDENPVNMQMNLPFHVFLLSNEGDLKLQASNYDATIFDVTEISEKIFRLFKNSSVLTVSISPVFDRMMQTDMLFHRSDYLPAERHLLPPKIYNGLIYTIIQESCIKIPSKVYEENLKQNSFPIAISMGGGDAPNKTKLLLEAVKLCKVPITFWVALGEGYQHSYDELIHLIKKNVSHEIILIRSNQSLWKIFRNCVLSILLSGITAYEAIYAGLPGIILYDNRNQRQLVKELFDKDLAIDGGEFSGNDIISLCSLIEQYYHQRQKLLQIHLRCRKVLPENGAAKIVGIIINYLNNLH